MLKVMEWAHWVDSPNPEVRPHREDQAQGWGLASLPTGSFSHSLPSMHPLCPESLQPTL